MAEDFDFEINIEDFADFEIENEVNFATRYIKPPRTKDRPENPLKYSNAKKLANDITIKKNDRYLIFVDGSFYFGDFIEALIIEKCYHVKTMMISTLSMNENNVDSLANLLNAGYVDQLNLIVSDYFFSHERHNLIPYLYKELDKKNRFQLAAASVHCKICQFETDNNGFVFMHGSANLRSSDNIEQICIEENETLYKGSLEFHSSIIEKFKTINKSVRNKNIKSLFKN
jgi:hypothetical protein